MGAVEIPIKHSGADWLKKTGNLKLSPLGVKVANVLGQVYLGIYHIDDSVLNKKVQWDNERYIRVVVSRGMATFDDSTLTFLCLSCELAGLGVRINGAYKGYLSLSFFEHEKKGNSSSFDVDDLSPIEAVSKIIGIKKTLTPIRDGVIVSTDPIGWTAAQRLIHLAHKNMVRLYITGRANMCIEMMITQRLKREGSAWERHPDLATHSQLLKNFTNIDYDSEV